MDEVVGGGLEARRAYLVHGRPGTGKTTLALQFLLAGAKCGEPVLYISFSESEQELAAVAASHGWVLQDVLLREMATALSDGEIESVSMFHAADVDLPQTMARIRQAIEDAEPTRVAVDSLTELRNIADNRRHFRRMLFQLKVFLERRGVTTLLIDEALADVATDAESLVHGVILLDRRTPAYGPVRRRLEISKLRGARYQEGFHDFVIESGGLRVFPRIRPRADGRSIDGRRLSSGVDGLDALVGGGLERGTTTLLVGPSGTGKSSIVLQYAVEAARAGEGSVIFTFDEDLAMVRRRAAALGLPLDGHLAAGRIRIRAVDATELSPGEFADRIRAEIGSAAYMAIDSINAYLLAMPEAAVVVPHLHDLLTYVGRHGVVLMLVMSECGLFVNASPPAHDISGLADTVLLLRQFEARGQVRTCIAALKHRTGDHDRLIREVSLGAGGLRIGDQIVGFDRILTGMPISHGGDMSRLDPAAAKGEGR